MGSRDKDLYVSFVGIVSVTLEKTHFLCSCWPKMPIFKGFTCEWQELLIRTQFVEANRRELIEIHFCLSAEGLDGHYGLIL